ncbi:DUF2752 domain-containing protein [Streptomyces sp. NPDC002889]|uniref:DUF2752 domain-containing protein n=1 Tax=Streptomyces sp. NPDC002889 TaxID=3364669 RepID=UPI0036753C80
MPSSTDPAQGPGGPAFEPSATHESAGSPQALGHPVPHVPGPARGPRAVPFARRIAMPMAAIASVAAAFAYVGTVDPNEPGHYPVCPLLRFTGIYCPGCGGLRSAHAFIHGDLATALGSNAVAVVGYGIFAVVWVMWLIRAAGGRPLRISLTPAWWWSAGGVVLIFSVVRNLPFGSALAP